MKTKKKNQKPIDIEANLKYRCPKPSCGFDHWLSLKESQAKGFKIVCDCGFVFKPKQISKLKIVYKENTKPIVKEDNSPIIKSTQPVPIVEVPKISVDFQQNCAKVLIGYGFTQSESMLLCEKAFEKNPINHIGSLVKYILQNLEQLDVNN